MSKDVKKASPQQVKGESGNQVDGQEGPASGDAVASVPDPTTMLYLRAGAVAFPRVYQYLMKQGTEDQMVSESNQELAVKLEHQIVQWVRQDIEERKDMHEEIEMMRSTKASLEKDYVLQEERFQETFHENQVKNAETLTTLRKQISLLQADAFEADAWKASRRQELQLLRSVHEKLETTKVAQEEEIKSLHDEHDLDRRKLRDLLVRKLRRVRDIMSSTTDDDAADHKANQQGIEDASPRRHQLSNHEGMLAKDAEYAAAVAMFQTPTAKLNEKLSRAVTMYERESKTIADSITQIHSSIKSAVEVLEEQRTHNEKLVLRNASQSKAKAMLKAQLEELAEKYKKVSDDKKTQEVQRRRALQETVRMQGDVVADLRGELEHNLNEYEQSVSELKALERQLKQRSKSAEEAKHFFLSIAGEQAVSSQALTTVEAPPSGFTGSAPPNATTNSVPQPTMSFTQMANREVVGLPVLQLTNPRDVALFFASVVHRGS